MATYPHLVQTAWKTLEAVIGQWQLQPFRWIKERDLQVELGSRLGQALSSQGLGTLTGPYGHGLTHYDDVQSWARVAFEPYIPYEANGVRSRCHPDIVIWDDLNGRSSPNYSLSEIWPIAWACELKYGSPDEGTWDIEKLRILIDQGRIQYGCSLRVQFSPADSGNGISWERVDRGRYLWICTVRTPPLNQAENQALRSG